MKVDVVDLSDGITIVSLDGRMDIEGASAADMKFSVIAGARIKMIVDLTRVEYIASLGMRTLIVAAKSTSSKGGKLALLGPQPGVEKALRSSGVDTVIPIAADLDAAVAHLN